MNRYNGIQCLRAIAALLVMIAHLKFVADFSDVSWIQSAAGAVGVDVFFVISGFVISISAKNLNYNATSFFINRFCRVAPFYWFFSIPFIILSLYHENFNFLQLVNTFIFIPFFDVGHYTNPSHPYGWTLSFEMMFYVLFFFCLKAVKHNASNLVVLVFSAGCLILSLMPSISNVIYVVDFIFHPFVIEFVFGIMIYKFSRFFNIYSFFLSLVLFLVFCVFVIKLERLGWHIEVLGSYQLGFKRAFYWGGMGAFLTIAAISLDNIKIIKYPRFLLKLGDSSYSMYLVQPYCIMVVNKIGRLGFSSFSLAIIYLFSVVFVGVFISSLVEYRLTKKIKSILYSFLIIKK